MITPYQLEELASLINFLEADGLKFTVAGSNKELNININRFWIEIDKCRNQQELYAFADEINNALSPIKEKYIKLFRKKLAEKAIEFSAQKKEV